MTTNADQVKQSVIEYCASIGKDPLLVQGAGGNVSWKDGDTLWVKASGTWIADAAEQDIFVPVDLAHLHDAIKQQDFDVTPRIIGDSTLRPSIETLLHALMPHRIVVHLHSVVILAILVREHCEDVLSALVDKTISWSVVDYQKPGPALAQAISIVLVKNASLDVLFLKNHGVVIGGQSVEEIQCMLTQLNELLYEPGNRKQPILALDNECEALREEGYSLLPDPEMQALALDPEFFNRLASNWALYPDHVVFLGAEAPVFSDWNEFHVTAHSIDRKPELIIIQGSGVFILPTFNKSKLDQLRCYYDVLSALPCDVKLKVLDEKAVGDLLNWDAEKYRMSIVKM